MSGYIGTQPVPQATQTRDAFTATAGQTSFATSGYTPSFLDVFLNGVKLSAADYTASNGSDVVLASGAATGDILEVVAYTSFDTANVTGAANFTVTGSFTSQGIDDNATSTAMTLDGSGNLMVGTTSFTGTSGVSLSATGYVYASSTNDVAIYANRETSDGDIAVFRKDGSTVGSIGAAGGDAYFGTGDTGIIAYDNGNAILPFNTATGAYADNSLDFGVATQRFKDLYLSGGVYLGGTGSANKLDDYEEGTWTPTIAQGGFSSATGTAYYTKIGRVVNVIWEGAIRGTGTSTLLQIGGLPFSATTWSAGSMYAQFYNDEGSQLLTAAVRSGGTNISFISWGAEASGSDFTDGYFAINITYRTNS